MRKQETNQWILSTPESQRDFLLCRLKRHPLLSLSVAVVLFVILLAFFFHWEDLAPRLGAVLVALTVAWEVRVLSVDLLKRERDIIHVVCVEAKEISEYIVEYHRHNCHPQSGDQARYPPIVTESSFHTPKRFAEQYAKDIRLMQILVAGAVCLGTLLWAFGDWLVCLSHFNGFRCFE